MSRPGPTPFQRAQISVETIGVSSAAIQRCYANPNQVRESTYLRICAAVAKLRIKPPPKRTGDESHRGPSKKDRTKGGG